MSETAQQGFKPPYMAFQTFWNFVDELSTHPLPPVIDRSLMNSKSGTDQANLFATLKAFELISEDAVVQPGLTALTEADQDGRKPLLAEIVRKYYVPALAVAEANGTQAQLEAAFRESFDIASADTLRKAITFFLHAARVSDVALSPYFKATRSGQGAPGAPRKRAAKRKPKNGVAEPEVAAVQQPAIPDAYRLDVRLRTGGTMTLTVNVNPISLRGEDRSFFYDIVDKMTDYEQPEPEQAEGETVDGT